MSNIVRIGLYVALTAGLVVGVYNTATYWPGSFSLEDWTANWRNVENGLKSAEKLEATRTRLLDRIRMKQAITRDVVNGNVPLLEAAAKFRDLDRDFPSFQWKTTRERAPESTYEEFLCRQVISWVEGVQSEGESDKIQAVLNRLNKELETRLKQGRICLPESR